MKKVSFINDVDVDVDFGGGGGNASTPAPLSPLDDFQKLSPLILPSNRSLTSPQASSSASPAARHILKKCSSAASRRSS